MEVKTDAMSNASITYILYNKIEQEGVINSLLLTCVLGTWYVLFYNYIFTRSVSGQTYHSCSNTKIRLSFLRILYPDL